jgi:PAS domain S-box-containing protein
VLISEERLWNVLLFEEPFPASTRRIDGANVAHQAENEAMSRSSSDRTQFPHNRRTQRIRKGSPRTRRATNDKNTALETVGRKQEAKAPRESEERFRKIFERSHDAIFVLDPLADKIIECNPRGCELLGFSSRELLSKRVSDIYPGEMPKLLALAQRHSKNENGWTGELACLTRSGTSLQAEMSAAIIHTDGKDHVLAIVRDITQRKQAEQALRESEQGFRHLVEHAADAVFLVDDKYRFAYANQRACDWLGYTREELLTMSIPDIQVEISLETINQVWKRMVPGVPVTFTGTHRRKDGTRFPVEIREGLIELSGRQYRFALVRDITERRRVQEELKEAKEELERRVEARTAELERANARLQEQIAVHKRELAAMEASMDGIAILESDEAYVYINEAHAKIYGYAGPEALLGKSWRELYFDDEIKKIEQEAQPWLREKGHWQGEIMGKRRDGSTIETEISLTTIAGGGLICICRDITERKKAEEALRRYTKRLETLQEIDRAILAARSPENIALAALHHIQDLVPSLRASFTIFDSETKEVIVMATQSRGETRIGAGTRWPIVSFEMVEMLRQGKPMVVNDIWDRALSPIVEALRAEGVRSSANVPLIATGEFIGTINLASEKPGAFSNEDVEIVGEIANSLAIAIQQARLHEQVQRHAAELEQRVAERTAELESFSYSVSHDLRSPLRAIDGFSRILLEDHAGKLDTECQRLLKVIRSNTQNMGRLIDDLLAFSRLGRKEIQPSAIDMGELAKIVFEELKAQTPERKLQITIKPLPGAYGDRSMLRQVFVNLISNSIKFTRDREVVSIEIGAEIEDHQSVYYVKDSGVGFDMRYVHKLFGVFQRLHAAEEYEGTGVGLAIVHRIIQRHGGRVWAEGEVDAGATIYFTLPRKGART